jgi:hypothetical protein
MALEYTPAAYGANTASEFIALLSNYYRMCVNIESSEAIERKTTELPAEGEQLNILLLP